MKSNIPLSNKTEGYVRDKDDFFETPPECVVAFQQAEGTKIPLQIWEPACGKGAIVRAMPAREWVATDLVERGFGSSRIDFLSERHKLADAIVTNPPFKLLDQFMLKAIELEVSYAAFFHPVMAFNTTYWQRIYDLRPPARIYILTWRPDIFGIGQPDQRCSYAWSVWDDRFDRDPLHTIYQPMRRPK